MKVIVPDRKICIVPDLLLINQVEERLDIKTKTATNKITWTDQHGTERNITKITDSHAANLVRWLRNRGLAITEKIIQGELERRCTGAYPENFKDMIESYKLNPEIWRLKIY